MFVMYNFAIIRKVFSINTIVVFFVANFLNVWSIRLYSYLLEWLLIFSPLFVLLFMTPVMLLIP